ncbi:unnamed protein product, partial [Rotaria sp. Silwood1]
VILSIAIAGLALEYARRSKNDLDKEARHQERLAKMERQLSELEITFTNQSAHLRELERLIQNHVSPPSKSTKSSTSTSLPESVSSLLTTNKKQVAQAFSIVEQSSNQLPLMQLHTIDYVFFPIAYAIQQTNDFIVSLLKQWPSLRRTK